MATCLCDGFFADVARATVEVLEHVGCTIDFPPDQTCCGQPPFNAGDWNASRKVVRHMTGVFTGEQPVVVPSGSCAAMVFHGAPLEFEDQPENERTAVAGLAGRTWELADYLVNGLGIERWEGRFDKKVAFHRSCHSRGTLSGDASLQLLQSIDGLELVSFGEGEQCCGFGGAFSVSFPNVSARMGELKIEHVTAVEPDVLVSGDMGCMLHLGGMIDKCKVALPRLHVAQVLRDALHAR
ncbi:MAG: (Fe-S)-binding protein [Opitutales bacterium]